MRIGDRLITADIREKQQARVEYETARSEGRTAALLEEHLPNVFQMNVANIMPGDDIRVELHYTELLVPQSGDYQFVFPMVVGPRHSNPHTQDARSQAAAAATSIPYHHTGEPNSATFNIKTHIDLPLGIKNIASPSHALRTVFSNDKHRASVEMEQGFRVSNRDFILNYQLAGDKVESGVMLYQGKDENFFLAMVQPPKTISPEVIPARDYIFVVDISGSMGGFPLDTAKVVVKELMAGLGYFTACAATLWSQAGNRLFMLRLPLVGMLILSGNILRNSLLVTLQAGGSAVPEWLHQGIGLVMLGLVCISIAWLMCQQRLSESLQKRPTLQTVLLQPGSKKWQAGGMIFLTLCALWTTHYTFARPHTVANPQSIFVEWPHEWDGSNLRPLALSTVEERFAQGFPGAMARVTDGHQMFVFRHVTSPTRMLHPAADCYRGLGYQVSHEQIQTDEQNRLWRCFVANRQGQALQVCERIEDMHGQA